MSDTFVDDVQSGSSPDAGQQDSTSQQGQPEGQGGFDGGTGEDGGQIPRHRLNEVIEQRRAWEQRAQEFWNQNQQLQQQLAELSRQVAGRQQPQNQPQVDPVTAKVRDQILQVLPELKGLLELADKKDLLLKAGEAVPSFEEAQKLQWKMRGGESMRILNGEIDSTFKGTKVPDANRRFFQAAFIDWLDTSGERQQRYMDGEGPQLAKEFWQVYNQSILQPLRRGAAVDISQAGQRVNRLPRMGTTSAVVPGGQKPAQPKTPEEVHDAAWDALQQRLSGS